MSGNRPKIMLLITGLGVGGAEAVVRDLAAHMDRNRFHPTVVTLLPRGPVGDRLEACGIPCIALGNGTRNPAILLMRLSRLLRSHRPDILHTHLFHADALGRIAARIAGIRVVVSTLHNITFGGKVREFFLRSTRRLVTGFVAVAAVVRDYASAHGIAPVGKIDIIYNGIDVTRFTVAEGKTALRRKLNLPESATIIISVGRLIEQKGYPDLLVALATVRADLPGQDIRLVILGEGSDRGALETIAAAFPPDTVLLPGAVPNVPQYLAAADLFVMSSRWEGFSLALVEAALSGLPIVATSVGIAPEFIRDNENGRLVAPGDQAGLSSAIQGILRSSPGDRALLASRAQDSARTLFSETVMARAHESLYETLLESNR